MASKVTERLMNLVLALMSSSQYLTRAQIARIVEGYGGQSQAAMERMFERDKVQLRQMGVPIETVEPDGWFVDDYGYRIRREDFELAPVKFTQAEASVVALAARVWDSQARAGRAEGAIRKLDVVGAEPDAARVAALQRAIAGPIAEAPAQLEALFAAVTARRQVRFAYRSEPRHVQPWALGQRRGAWYLLGFDVDRGAERLFKLARITGDVAVADAADAYDIPADVGPDSIAARLADAGTQEAVLRIADDAAPALRRRCRQAPDGAWLLAYADAAVAAAEICEYAPDVHVEGPDELQAAVAAHLEAVAHGA